MSVTLPVMRPSWGLAVSDAPQAKINARLAALD
jgi:hypothetical protein